MNPTLSICIPTYNRAKCLQQLLRSFEAECGAAMEADCVEIVIGDNNSDDDTKAIAQAFATGHQSSLRVKYLMQQENIGPIKNLMNVVENATGEYVWLMGDDDIFVNASIEKMLNLLRGERCVEYVLVPRALADVNLNPIPGTTQPNGVQSDAFFQSGRELLSGYDSKLLHIIGFYGSIVLRRVRWLQNARHLEPLGGWSHLRLLVHAIRDCPCAVLGSVGVVGRLQPTFRRPHAMSLVYLDEYVDIFLVAMRLGYDARLCDDMITTIVRGSSKCFVVDKAMGRRCGSVFSILRGRRMAVRVAYINGWAIMSVFPQGLLALLWRLYRLFRPVSWIAPEQPF